MHHQAAFAENRDLDQAPLHAQILDMGARSAEGEPIQAPPDQGSVQRDGLDAIQTSEADGLGRAGHQIVLVAIHHDVAQHASRTFLDPDSIRLRAEKGGATQLDPRGPSGEEPDALAAWFEVAFDAANDEIHCVDAAGAGAQSGAARVLHRNPFELRLSSICEADTRA